jgi:hypothetical protein
MFGLEKLRQLVDSKGMATHNPSPRQKALTRWRSGIGYTSESDITETPRGASLFLVVTFVFFFFSFLLSEFTTYSLRTVETEFFANLAS